MASKDGGSLIERKRAQSAEADRVILAALTDAAPGPLTVPELAARTPELGAAEESRQVRIRSRLKVLAVAGQVRAEGRQYYAVGIDSAPVLDPRDQVIAEQRVAWLAAAEQAGYLGRIGDLLRELDGRAVPTGQNDRAAAARSLLRSIQQAAGKCDREMFVRIRDEWESGMLAIEQFAQQCARDRAEGRRTQVADRAWVAAHQADIDAKSHRIRRHIRKLEQEQDEIFDLIDSAPAGTSRLHAMIPVPSDDIDWCEKEGWIIVSKLNNNTYEYRSGVDHNHCIQVSRRGFSLHDESPRLTWPQLLPFLNLAANAYEEHLTQFAAELSALAAERRRDPAVARGIGGAPRQLLAIEE